MGALQPLYTADNCQFSAPLRWGLTVFWRAATNDVNRVKGRLQYLVRQSQPKALQRNYALRSFGAATREAVEKYVGSQLAHHRMADHRVEPMKASWPSTYAARNREGL